jgi:hypothetical protein
MNGIDWEELRVVSVSLMAKPVNVLLGRDAGTMNGLVLVTEGAGVRRVGDKFLSFQYNATNASAVKIRW